MSDEKQTNMRNVATMTAAQLELYIKAYDAKTKLIMKELRALLKVRKAMEAQD
jgi:hypothetical protein